MKRIFVSVLSLFLCLSFAEAVFSQEKPSEPKNADSSFFEADGNIKPLNRVDKLVLAQLKEKKLKPAPLCSDAVFVRRLYVDLLGRIPTCGEAVRFLEDADSDKRARLIDELLETERFSEYQALRWADLLRIKSEFPINLWPNGAAVYHRWLLKSIRENKPYDQFVRELLTSSGSNFRDGPCNFYRAIPMRDADSIAEAAALLFMNVQTPRLSDAERKNLSVFFSRVAYKGTAQWKEEIVYWDQTPPDAKEYLFPDGGRSAVSEDKDPREVFADWLIRPENRAFHDAVVNRVWTWLMGSELFSAADESSAEGAPVCPKLSEYLADELIRQKYDLKQLYRLLLNSRTYQQSSLIKEDRESAEKYFAVFPIRRLEAEVLQDTLIQIFELQVTYQSETPEPYSYLPANLRTIQLPDAGITSSFLEMFGRSTRDTGTETDRNNDVSASQELFLLNSNEINQMVQKLAARILSGKGAESPPRDLGPDQNPNQARIDALEQLWLTFLSRLPTESERNRFQESFQKGKRPDKKGLADIIWTLLNSKEFLCQH